MNEKENFKEEVKKELENVIRQCIDKKMEEIKVDIRKLIEDKIKEVLEVNLMMTLEAIIKKHSDKITCEMQDQIKEQGKSTAKEEKRNAFDSFGTLSCDSDVNIGIKTGKINENWRNDEEYRKRLIRIYKGDFYNHNKSMVTPAKWMEQWLTEEEKNEIQIVRSDANAMWMECKNLELKEKIMLRKREIKVMDWYRIDDAMTEKERKARYKLEDYAASVRVKGLTIKREWDKIRIGKNLYGWNEERKEIYVVEE